MKCLLCGYFVPGTGRRDARECPAPQLHDVWLQEQSGRRPLDPGLYGVLERLGVPGVPGRRIDPKRPELFLREPAPCAVWDAHTVPCVWVEPRWYEMFDYLVAMRDFHEPMAKLFVRRGLDDPEFLQAAVALARVARVDPSHSNALEAVVNGGLMGDALSPLQQRRVLSDMMALYQTWYRCSSLEASW